MRILSIQENNLYKISEPRPLNTFKGRGKPITLEYILEKRAYLLPERVLNKVKEVLASNETNKPSLLKIHKDIYAPLLKCNTLDEAKLLFKEFENIKDEVVFKRDSRYARDFKSRTGNNFALKMLQETWANLKNKDKIAESFGMPSRSTLEWALGQINFVYYKQNYKTLLNASDEEGNRIIASKTTAWNQLHPDLMFNKNKQAAQGCKTEEYRKAHSKRMKEYDITHPERREKISKANKIAWANCPEIREAMKAFANEVEPYTKSIVIKNIKGEKLSTYEERIKRSFYKRFWDKHPELKKVFAKAKKDARNSL